MTGGLPRVVLATRNPGKIAELARILAGVAELVGLPAVEAYPEVVESGETFADNALLKARECVRRCGHPAIADDSGLAVDALHGLPGIFSARWAGRHGDDRANLELLLGQLADVPDERRAAAFWCAAALVLPDGREFVETAQLRGRLLREPRGRHGFGYDPIFVPAGHSVTTAQLEPAAKDAISHRGRAFRALRPVLAAALARAEPGP